MNGTVTVRWMLSLLHQPAAHWHYDETVKGATSRSLTRSLTVACARSRATKDQRFARLNRRVADPSLSQKRVSFLLLTRQLAAETF